MKQENRNAFFYDVIAARRGYQLSQFIYGKKFTHGIRLLRFLFGFQQLERIAVNQPIPYSLAQCGSQTIDKDAAGGTSQRLFSVVEGAGFQKAMKPA